MMADQWLGLEPNDSCSGDLERDSCILTESQVRICRGGWGAPVGAGKGGREGQLDKRCMYRAFRRPTPIHPALRLTPYL